MTLPASHPSLVAVLADRPHVSLSHLTAEEWETILDQVSTHGLMYLLQGFSGLPASLEEQVHQECLGITARNLALAGELRKFLRAFRDQRIPCLPLRGLALAERLYGDIPPRPSSARCCCVARWRKTSTTLCVAVDCPRPNATPGSKKRCR